MGDFWNWVFSPSNKYDVTKIEKGFTKDQVRTIFGEPEQVVQGGMVPEEWIYTVPFRIYAAISFDVGGKVLRTYRSGEPM